MRTINLQTALATQRPAQPAPRRSLARILGHVVLGAASLVVGLVAYVAHEHFALQGNSTWSLATLVGAGGLVLMPLRAVLHLVFAVERKVMHLVHGVMGLALVGLTLGGGVSGGPLLSHAALAPFEMMGAAQALMHSTHPRNAAQASALQQFATSLPQVEAFSHGDVLSPANARREVAVLTDLLTKAQRLGQTELQADPNFQGALRAATTRATLSLGLDAIQRAIGSLAGNAAVAGQLPDLQRRVAAARHTIAR